ncbi:YdcF family protein [Dyadobacter tibetensis]|uniref:YdcF family protein n=1 Tax=Dyadobacter tibetensis TaxID=1211851 RepID=UPI0004B10FD9|nr:YdcF family protein [Dyadobacter tibetensis]
MSNLRIVNWAFQSWEIEGQEINEINGPSMVGVLLTGGLVNYAQHSAGQLGMGRQADRFMQIFQLYKLKKIKKIVITGTNADWLLVRGKGEGQQVMRWLIDWGVAPDDIILEEQARNTRENALFTKKILDEKFPDDSYILVTSAFHMRRAKACFNKVGIEVAVFPAGHYGGNVNFTLKESLIPEASAAGDFSVIWHEWIGYLIYRLMGYC